MAIRERKGRAKPWQCYWNNPYTGKRESQSFATREEAEKEDSLVKHRLRFERESFKHENNEKEVNQEITLEQAFLLYLREKQFSGTTLEWQFYIMRLPLKMYGNSPVDKISVAEITAFRDKLSNTEVKATTIKAYLGGLKALFRWCAENGFCEMPQFPKLPRARQERFIPPTPAELEAILQAAPQHIQRVVIIGAQLGARVGPSELFRLTWKDVDLTQGIIRIHGAKKNPNAPWREVPIRQSLIPIMARWAMQDKKDDMEYIIHYGGKPVQSIKKSWANTLARAGITRRIRPYDLRHAFATELVAAGVDIGTVAKLMGHSGPTMLLEHYQFVMDKQKRKAVEGLPDLLHVPKPCAQKNKGTYDLS